jgi:hypothetical protein
VAAPKVENGTAIVHNVEEVKVDIVHEEIHQEEEVHHHEIHDAVVKH